MPHILQQIDPQAEHLSVCNNATWAAGEIALKWGKRKQSSCTKSRQANFLMIKVLKLEIMSNLYYNAYYL